jgi:hypothetical protein
MTVVSNLILKPNGPDDVEAFLKLAKGAVESVGQVPGVTSVSFVACTIGGEETNAFSFLTTTADWESFGKVQQLINSSPEFIKLLLDAGKHATWKTYVGQEVDFSLLP